MVKLIVDKNVTVSLIFIQRDYALYKCCVRCIVVLVHDLTNVDICMLNLLLNAQNTHTFVGSVSRALNFGTEGLGFDSWCMSCEFYLWVRYFTSISLLYPGINGYQLY